MVAMKQYSYLQVSGYKISWGPYTDQLARTKHRALITMIRVLHLGNKSPICKHITRHGGNSERCRSAAPSYFAEESVQDTLLGCRARFVMQRRSFPSIDSLKHFDLCMVSCLIGRTSHESTPCYRPQIVCWMTETYVPSCKCQWYSLGSARPTSSAPQHYE